MGDNGMDMILGRCWRREALPGITFLLLLGLVVDAGAAPAKERASTAPLCVGRFLIDASQVADLHPGYVYARKTVTTQRNVDRSHFQQMLAAREADLRTARHRSGAPMLVSTVQIDDDALLLTSWFSDSSRAGHRQQLYVFEPDHQQVFVVAGETDAAKLAGAVENYRGLRQRLRYRDPMAVPTEPGFCIDSGFIAGERINSEEVTIALSPLGHPAARVTLMSRVIGAPDAPLLDRVRGLPAQAVRLRSGAYVLGDMEGQELLLRNGGKGWATYSFLWEFQGTPESLTHPFLSLQLSTESAASFKDDDEAVQVWGQVLRSLRLRPEAD